MTDRALDPVVAALRVVKGGDAPPTRMGTVTGTTGGVQVQMDGETSNTGRAYPKIESYTTPTIGHRVLLLRAGSTWVVLGRII